METRTKCEGKESEKEETGVFGGGVRRERAGSWAWVYLALFGGRKVEDAAEKEDGSR